MNKHLLAVGIALLTFVAYLILLIRLLDRPRMADGFVAAGVLVGTFAAVSCLILAIEICRHDVLDLGKLRDERSALLGGLFFTFAIGTVAVGIAFFDLLAAARPLPDKLWIHASWGVEGRCDKPLKIGSGADEKELAIETGGERHTRRILGKPTENEVTTDGGAFELSADGNMTSTVPGYADSKFERCRK